MNRLFGAILLIALAGVPAMPVGAAEPVRIAILDDSGRAGTPTWAATAEYLEQRVAGFEFRIEATGAAELRRRLRDGELEFALLDPGLYVELAHEHAVTPLLTRRMPTSRQPQSRFGALLLTRAERADIERLSDLKGKSLMAAHGTFGSFHLVWRELERESILPFRDLGAIRLERDPERVVRTLAADNIDVIAVPTGVFEELQARGAVEPGAFRVLNAQTNQNFPYAHSTRLYPEWPLVATGHTTRPLKQGVRAALLALGPDHPAARADHYAGWALPLSYEPVEELYRELQLGPYAHEPLLAYARAHWEALLGIALVFVGVIAAAVYVLHMNRRLAQAIRRGQRARERMQMFASAVEQTTDAVIITDPNGIIEYVNPAFTAISGYEPGEVIGRTPALLKSGQHDPLFYARLWTTIARGDAYHDEIVNRRKDGTLFWEQKSIVPLRDAEGRISHFVATGRDITDRRIAEEEANLRREQLAHTARVNIIGEMAASIAHEISQPLTAIMNYAQGSLRRLRRPEADPEPLRCVLSQIVAQAQRASEAIVTLRRFVARRKPQRVRADVNALVRQITALAASETRGRGISVALKLAENLPPASVDDVQIEQVVLNLLRNGAEALASSDAAARRLTLRTALAPDGSIEVSISDTGPGLPPRLAAKLFEPFFTTKPDGVGLGLAVSRSIVETHGGRIWVTPNPDRGVTFRFTLPVETQTHEQ